MDSFQLGPFGLSARLALLTTAVVVAHFVGSYIARKRGANIKRAFWSVFFVGISSSRLAFVMVYRDLYASAPWKVLDFRDGGFNVAVGIAGAVVMLTLLVLRNRSWCKPLLVSFLAGAAVWPGITIMTGFGGPPAGLPNVELVNAGGNPVKMHSLSGKPMVINLWATWCPPCRREMPVLRDAQRSNQDITFVYANQGESVATVQSYLETQQLVLDNVLFDPAGTLAKQVGSVALPTTLFFNAQGTLVDTRIGELSAATLSQRLQSLQTAR